MERSEYLGRYIRTTRNQNIYISSTINLRLSRTAKGTRTAQHGGQALFRQVGGKHLYWAISNHLDLCNKTNN